MTESTNGYPRVTHRLICDDCYKFVCSYSFMTTERNFMKQLGNVLCHKCSKKATGVSQND